MRVSDKHPFFQVPRTPHRTSEGTVDLPILYYDVSNVVALFRAPRASVARLLVGTELEPVSMFGDDAVVALSFFEYRHTSVGPYNEVGSATFVKRKGERTPWFSFRDLFGDPRRRSIGATIFDLPVTTAAAWAAGRELWGYPKFVTDISFRLATRTFESTVHDPQGESTIVTLSGELGPSIPAPPMSLMLYSQLDGRCLRTHVHVRGLAWAHAPGSCMLRVGASQHPMAERLRALGLDGQKPRIVLTTTDFQSRLHAGTVVASGREGTSGSS